MFRRLWLGTYTPQYIIFMMPLMLLFTIACATSSVNAAGPWQWTGCWQPRALHTLMELSHVNLNFLDGGN